MPAGVGDLMQDTHATQDFGWVQPLRSAEGMAEKVTQSLLRWIHQFGAHTDPIFFYLSERR